MVVPLVLLVVLIALAPACGIIGGNAATGLVCAVAAVALATMAVASSAGAVRRLGTSLRPALLITVLAPLVWMLLQVAPLPVDWFSDPVWASTSATLSRPIAGSISVDTGATLLSILRYCAVLATAIIAAALTLERPSAGRMLYLLTAVGALVAGVQIARELGYFWFWHSAGRDIGAALIAAIGIIASTSVLIRLRQQLSRKRKRAGFPSRATIAAFAATGTALALCTLSILIPEDMTVLFAAVFGAGVPVSIFAIRRWSLGVWGKLGVIATASMVLVGFLAIIPFETDADPALALSPYSSATAELMLSDVPLLGRGAGSVQDILPAYRDLNDRFPRRSITAAALITVEMGRAFLWMFVLALTAGAALLIRASLSRSRDHVYAATGAGILVATLLVTFVNSNLLELPASLVATAALGLAWAQSRSDSNNGNSPLEVSGRALPTSEGGRLHGAAVRFACLLFSLVLMAGAFWILMPQFYSSGGLRSGKARPVASIAEGENLDKAASLALVRGDLWAKSALASAALLESNPAPNSADDRVRERLVKALTYAPYQPDVWLRLARLADQFKWSGYDVPALLKMVYYTGSNEVDLVAARTKLALRLAPTSDPELQDFVKRDVNLILRRWPDLRPALAEAYRSANPEGRALADGAIARTDPAFLKAVRSQ